MFPKVYISTGVLKIRVQFCGNGTVFVGFVKGKTAGSEGVAKFESHKPGYKHVVHPIIWKMPRNLVNFGGESD